MRYLVSDGSLPAGGFLFYDDLRGRIHIRLDFLMHAMLFVHQIRKRRRRHRVRLAFEFHPRIDFPDRMWMIFAIEEVREDGAGTWAGAFRRPGILVAEITSRMVWGVMEPDVRLREIEADSAPDRISGLFRFRLGTTGRLGSLILPGIRVDAYSMRDVMEYPGMSWGIQGVWLERGEEYPVRDFQVEVPRGVRRLHPGGETSGFLVWGSDWMERALWAIPEDPEGRSFRLDMVRISDPYSGRRETLLWSLPGVTEIPPAIPDGRWAAVVRQPDGRPVLAVGFRDEFRVLEETGISERLRMALPVSGSAWAIVEDSGVILMDRMTVKEREEAPIREIFALAAALHARGQHVGEEDLLADRDLSRLVSRWDGESQAVRVRHRGRLAAVSFEHHGKIVFLPSGRVESVDAPVDGLDFEVGDGGFLVGDREFGFANSVFLRIRAFGPDGRRISVTRLDVPHLWDFLNIAFAGGFYIVLSVHDLDIETGRCSIAVTSIDREGKIRARVLLPELVHHFTIMKTWHFLALHTEELPDGVTLLAVRFRGDPPVLNIFIQPDGDLMVTSTRIA